MIIHKPDAVGCLQRKAKSPPFPVGMKERFVLLTLDLAETVHAAHVVYAVHDLSP